MPLQTGIGWTIGPVRGPKHVPGFPAAFQNDGSIPAQYGTLVSTNTQNPSGSALTTVYTVPVGVTHKQGNTLVLIGCSNAKTLTGVSDSRGAGFTIDAVRNDGTTAAGGIVSCALPVTLVAGDTVTLTWNASTGGRGVIALEYAGMFIAGYSDTAVTTITDSATASVTTLNVTPVAAATNDDIVLTSVIIGQTSVSGITFNGNFIQENLLATSGTIRTIAVADEQVFAGNMPDIGGASWVTANAAVGFIVAYKSLPLPVSAGTIYFDSNIIGMVITPSSVDVTDFTDTGIVTAVITPTSVDVAAYADDGTAGITLTPSAVEIHELTDSATVGMVITSSSVDTAQYTDASTPIVAITPSAAELHTTVDTATVGLVITPSSADVAALVDAATPVVGIVPSATEARISTDSASVALIITPSVIAGLPGSVIIQTFDSGVLSGATTTTVITVPALGVSTANTLLVFSTKNASAVADSKGNTYTKDIGLLGAATSQGISIWRKDPGGTALVSGDTITITHLSQGGRVGIALEVTGFLGSPIESSVTATLDYNSTGRTSLTFSGSAVTSNVNTRVFGVFTLDTNASSPVPGSGMTMEATQASSGTVRTLVVEDQLLTSTATPSADLSWTGSSLAQTGALVAYDVSPFVSGGEIAQFVDSGTIGLIITLSVVEGRESTDSATIGLLVTPSGVDVYVPGGTAYTDSVTVPVLLTTSAAETRESADSVTAGIVITPFASDTAQYADATTAVLKIDPGASVETGIIHTDSANVALLLSAGATEGAQFAEAQTVSVVLSPSTTEAAQFVDAVSVSMTMTPSSTDTAQYVESVTTRVTLTPSATEVYGRTLIDTGTVGVALTPSASESAQVFDAATVPVAISPSATDVLTPASIDSGIVGVTLTPSASESAVWVDSVTVPMVLSVSATDVPERAFLDSVTVPVTIDPSSTVEDINKADVGEIYLRMTPYALSEFQGDGDITRIRITSTFAEIFTYEDTNVVLLSIDMDSVEEVGTSTETIVAFQITPDIQEIFESVDDATILLSIKPGVIFEARIVADYLLAGVLSPKWSGILRDNHLATALKETRYIIVGFDNRWHYHWKGRGDE